MPSDSNFAIALKTQQAAEREEQQRIKDLVLRYDLREGEEQDGDSLLEPLPPNPNIHKYNAGFEKSVNHSRLDKSGNNRSGQRSRKLQLSDVDWYGSRDNLSQSQKEKAPAHAVAKSSRASQRQQERQFSRSVDSPTPQTRLTRKELLRSHAALSTSASHDEAKP